MNVKYVILHHTAVSRTKNNDQFVANNEYHRKKWDYKSSLGYYLGYHYEISPAGVVKQARTENEPGAHTAGYNDVSIGIAMDGNFDIEMPTQAQIDALKTLLSGVIQRHPGAAIAYHRNFAKKTCPGLLIADNWAKNLITNGENMIVDATKLEQIYQELLFRPTDDGAKGYIGQEELVVRDAVGKSEERMTYINLVNSARNLKK